MGEGGALLQEAETWRINHSRLPHSPLIYYPVTTVASTLSGPRKLSP